ncbi:hypothetical protein VOLCADRAFT_106974 [Volvox carteri f. nagariensis]|uniref:Uncharacterized protein n=1 Tax=Volvox carteri f. nagariensis TaxID=3068 RepID=D8UB33_VOLCA|nr:uncharacterized protein VOLCADRAFT_106974 [Volvox carteri f. nagariensis]EFJ43039.1 hypothetical protein VOLCADRAFT_106974 [Volvox carteri f. nagariensis]|eukprot:XP_002955838.1 hypothetical protein VOLCADRAFT_106974 [Volvox carteri f. nagariensis]
MHTTNIYNTPWNSGAYGGENAGLVARVDHHQNTVDRLPAAQARAYGAPNSARLPMTPENLPGRAPYASPGLSRRAFFGPTSARAWHPGTTPLLRHRFISRPS